MEGLAAENGNNTRNNITTFVESIAIVNCINIGNCISFMALRNNLWVKKEGIASGEAVFIFSNTPQPKPDIIKRK